MGWLKGGNWSVLEKKKKWGGGNKKLVEKTFSLLHSPLLHTWQDFQSHRSHPQARNVIIVFVRCQIKRPNTRLKNAYAFAMQYWVTRQSVLCAPLWFAVKIFHANSQSVVCTGHLRSLRVTRRSKWIESLSLFAQRRKKNEVSLSSFFLSLFFCIDRPVHIRSEAKKMPS